MKKTGKTIDCLFIGHNEMSFTRYEESVRKMGLKSGAYRDLTKNFIQYNGEPYHVTEVFNIFRPGDDANPAMKPFTMLETFNAAIAYLGTYLNRRGFTFDFVNSFQDEKEQLAERLLQENILTIAITTTLYVSVLPIIEIMNFIKMHNRTAKVIIGGPFISTKARTQDAIELEYLFKSLDADFYVNSSQGEGALTKIILALKNDFPFETVDNIYYKTAKGYQANGLSRENNQLSENRVNWSLFAHRLGEYAAVRTSISCPFSCSFCGFPEHAGQYQTMAVAAVEKELNQLDKIGSVKSVHFIDDTFNVPKNRFKRILRMMLHNRYRFHWHSYLRCQYADREMVELMKESGCEGVFLGIESGSNRILKNMNKAATSRQYYKGISLLKEYEIPTFGCFIIGFPGETDDTVSETIQFIEQSGLDFYRAQLWYCEPVTPIWKEKEKYQIQGNSFEWSHATMDSQKASDLIDEMFFNINQCTWVPQYNFDFDNLCHLLHREPNPGKIKTMLNAFNRGVKEKMMNPTNPEASFETVKQLKIAFQQENPLPFTADEKENINEKYDVDFDFNI